MQLKVIKADGIEEEYLHTKVLATFVNAFAQLADTSVAAELADAVTFYLYGKYGESKINSGEIFSIIQAVLSSTGHDDIAANLTGHHYRRQLLRARVEVIKFDARLFSDALKFHRHTAPSPANFWNKSKIINDLVAEYNLDRPTARTIASMVEEKILASGFRCVSTAFIEFLVLLQAQAVLAAGQQLQSYSNEETAVSSANNAAKEGRLRQPQNGLCPVEV
jgi:hypothetical protein